MNPREGLNVFWGFENSLATASSQTKIPRLSIPQCRR